MIARFGSRFWIRAGVFGLAGALVFFAVPLTFGQPEDGGRIRRSNEVVLDVVFSPGGGCQDRISEEIGNATESVRLQAFYYTSKPITDALIKARKRGVDVTVVLDKSQEKQTYGKWRLLARAGVPVYFDARHATANNKIVLIRRESRNDFRIARSCECSLV